MTRSALQLFFALVLVAFWADARFSVHQQNVALLGSSAFENDEIIRLEEIRTTEELENADEKSQILSLRRKVLSKAAKEAYLTLYNNNKGFRHISLKNCMFEDPSILPSIFLSAVQENSTIQSITIRHCHLDYDSLASCSSQLVKSRNANRNDSSTPVGPSLELMDVSFNKLDPKATRALASIISRCPKLSVLSLDGNKMTPDETKAIFLALRKHPSISYVSLSACSMTDECMEYIGYGLKSNRNITQLDISMNPITSAGFQTIFDAFRSGGGKHLTFLDVSYNSIGDLGVMNLARAFESNLLPSLKHLIVREVGASHLAIERLLTAIPPGCILETLDISGNALLPTKKKSKPHGYHPKNLKSMIEKQVTPHLSNAVKSVSGALNSHLQTAAQMLDKGKGELLLMTQNMKKAKSYRPRLPAPKKAAAAINNKKGSQAEEDDEEKPSAKGTRNTGSRSNVGRAGKRGERAAKTEKRVDSSAQPKPKSQQKTKASSTSKSRSPAYAKEVKAARELEKVQTRSMRALLRFTANARKLRTIGLAKVGLNVKSCEVARKLVAKMQTKRSTASSADERSAAIPTAAATGTLADEKQTTTTTTVNAVGSTEGPDNISAAIAKEKLLAAAGLTAKDLLSKPLDTEQIQPVVATTSGLGTSTASAVTVNESVEKLTSLAKSIAKSNSDGSNGSRDTAAAAVDVVLYLNDLDTKAAEELREILKSVASSLSS